MIADTKRLLLRELVKRDLNAIDCADLYALCEALCEPVRLDSDCVSVSVESFHFCVAVLSEFVVPRLIARARTASSASSSSSAAQSGPPCSAEEARLCSQMLNTFIERVFLRFANLFSDDASVSALSDACAKV